MRVFATALMLAAAMASPGLAGAQSRSAGSRAWADATIRFRVERNGCRRVVLTQAPVALAGFLVEGRDNPARNPDSQTGKMLEFRYMLGGSVGAASGFTAAGAAMCWAGYGLQLRNARKRGQRGGFGAPDLDAATWSNMHDRAERNVRVGRRATIAGAAAMTLGTLASLVHVPESSERGLDRIGGGAPLLLGGALAASIGGAIWADGASRLTSLGQVPQRSTAAWMAIGPHGRRGVEIRVTMAF